MLLALAGEPGAIYSEEYRRRHRLGAASSVQKSVTRLLARELIEEMAGGGYRISDVFLRAWVSRLTAPGATLPRE